MCKAVKIRRMKVRKRSEGLAVMLELWDHSGFDLHLDKCKQAGKHSHMVII